MNLVRTSRIVTPLGDLWLSFTPNGELCRCDVKAPDNRKPTEPPFAAPSLVLQQLASYFTGTLKQFTFRYILTGTPFQHKVWEAAIGIPYGETRTYSDLAYQLGNPEAARAVGRALGANPLLIVVPCHRVVPASGGIGGYRGGARIKEFLLSHEAQSIPVH